MSDTQDKVVKIKIATDGSDVYKFKAMVNSMTSSVEKLASTLDRVTRSLEGFSKAQGKMKPGSVGPTTTPGGKSGGIAETIIGGGDGSAVRNAAKATEQALSNTGDNIKRFVDRAIQDINRLNQATKGAGQGPSYSGWTSSTGAYGGGGMGGGFSGAGPGYSDFERGISGIEPPGTTRHPGGRWTGKRSIFHPLTVKDEEESASKLWGPKGFAGYMEGRGQALGRMLGLSVGGQNMLGNAGKFVGSNMGLLGGTVMGGIALLNAGATAFEDTRAARINFTQNQPFMKLQSASNAASIFNNQFAAIQGGNISRVMAFNKTMKDPEIMKSLGSASLDNEKLLLAYKQSPLSLGSGYAWLKDQLQAGGATVFQSILEKVGGSNLDEATKKSIREIGFAQAQAGLSGEKAQKFNQALENYQALESPMMNMMADKIYGGALGRTQTMRMNLMSTGVNPKTGMTRYEELEANLLRKGWTPSDRAAGLQQILGIGHGYGKAIDPITLMSTGIAGLTNTAQLVQQGGILGGGVGAARQFYKTVQSSIGTGGLDVAVGRDMFSNLASGMMGTGQFGAGNTASTYMGLAAGLVGGIGSDNMATLDVAQQQRRMALLNAGNAAFGGITAGSQAPLYSATSLLGGIKAMGGEYSLGAESLSRMDPRLLTSIARGGDVPEWAKAQGIGKIQAAAFLNYQRQAPLFEVADDMVNGSAKTLLSKVRSAEAGGGSFLDVIKSETHGMRGKAKAIAAQKIAEQLGGIAAPFLNTDPDTAAGIFMSQLAQSDIFARPLHGRGVGAPGPSGLEAESLGQQSNLLNEQARFAGKNAKTMSAAFSTVTPGSRAAQLGQANAASSRNAEIDGMTQNVISALLAYSEFMKANSGGKVGRPQVAVPK